MPDTLEANQQAYRIIRSTIKAERANGSYIDTGCSLFPKCLECPLPRCRYDMRVGEQRLRKMLRNLKIKQEWDERRTLKELAEEYGLSEWTIRRVVGPRCRKLL